MLVSRLYLTHMESVYTIYYNIVKLKYRNPTPKSFHSGESDHSKLLPWQPVTWFTDINREVF